MMEFLVYDLKVAVLIAVFYMFYRLLLSRETFHHVNRAVLLSTAVASFVLPLCVITFHRTVVVDVPDFAIYLDGLRAAVEGEPPSPLWQSLAIGLFFAGVAVSLGYTLVSVLRVCLLISRSERHPQADGTVICVTDQPLSPFSWMRYIVLSPSDYEALDASVLAHERGHISQHHSLDLILVDTLTALQWFNPAMWMLRQDLRAIHEYEADAAVLSQGINMRQYQYLLIQKAVSRCGYSVANGISHSTLKNRIDMMLNKKSNSAGLLKLLALVPIVGVTLALQAETVTDYVYNTPQTPQKKVVKKGRRNGQIKVNDKTIEVKADDAAAPAPKTAEAKDEKKARVAPKIVFGDIQEGREPLLILNGKVATREQVMALDQEEINDITAAENEEWKSQIAAHFKADTSNGVIFIRTKDYVKNGGSKELLSVHVKAKNPEAAEEKPQKTDEKEAGTPNEAFDVVEQMPEFNGGISELMKYLSANIKYPAEAEKAGVQGRVLVQFVIDKDGSVGNAKVVKSVSEELDAEALRVINAMPNWKPGRQKGEAVRVKYTIPISFRLAPSKKDDQAQPAEKQ